MGQQFWDVGGDQPDAVSREACWGHRGDQASLCMVPGAAGHLA